MRIKPFLPAIAWTIIIFILSTGASVQVPFPGLSPDKIAHLAAYGLLVFLFMVAFWKVGKVSITASTWVVLLSSLYGAALEVVQWAFFPNRLFEVWDMIANITGAIIGFLLFKLLDKNGLLKIF